MKNRKALLVIDMQKGSFTPKTPRFDTIGVIKRINELAELFRELNYPVVYIQHDGTGTGEFEKNNTDWENLEELIVGYKDIRIDKYANDVFYKSQLQSKLQELNVNELFSALVGVRKVQASCLFSAYYALHFSALTSDNLWVGKLGRQV